MRRFLRTSCFALCVGLAACTRAAQEPVASRQSGEPATPPPEAPADGETAPETSTEPPPLPVPDNPPTAEPVTAPPGVLLSDPHIRVPPVGDTLAPAVHQQERIARCRGHAEVRITEAEPDRVTIARLRLDGRRTVIATAEDQHGLAVNRAATRAASTKGVLDLRTGASKSISGSESWRWPSFLPTTDLLVTYVADYTGDVASALVADARTGKIVHRTTGYAHTVTPDGALVYVEPEATSSDQPSRYADVLVYQTGKVRHIARVPTPSGDYNLAVTGIAAASASEIVYRVSEEHEHRFLNLDGTPFYGAGYGHLLASPDGGFGGLGMSKEQYDLEFSPDGRYAAFAERNWNQLTYVVLIDLRKKKRIELPYYGSFPAVRGRTLYFSSDPSFVRAPIHGRHDTNSKPVPEVEFRQIEDWALYAFDIPTKRLCLVRAFDHYVQVSP